MMKMIARSAALVVVAGLAGPAFAQGVPVHDQQVLNQALQTAQHTSSIMDSNAQILDTVNKTLTALTGNRQTGTLMQAALGGGGFNMGGAPNFSSLLGGSSMQWGNLGSFGTMASTIMNKLDLVKSLSGDGSTPLNSGTNTAYMGSVNTAAAVMGMIAGSQQSSQARTQAFQSAAQTIGTATDVKGSIDQNSQLQVQTGLTINELIGAVNANNAVLSAQQQSQLAAQAFQTKIFSYTGSPSSSSGSQFSTTNGQD